MIDIDYQVKVIGKEAQKKLEKIKIAIIGLGALGSVFAELAVRAGIKSFILYDDDIVEEKNLHRQLYTRNDIGKYKVDAIKERLMSISDCDIEANRERFMPEDVVSFDKETVIAECTDNLRNKVIMANNLSGNAMILGTVAGYVGYAAITREPIDDIFKKPCSSDECHVRGVLNATTTMVSSLMMSLLFDYVKWGYKKRILYLNKNEVRELKIRQRL